MGESQNCARTPIQGAPGPSAPLGYVSVVGANPEYAAGETVRYRGGDVFDRLVRTGDVGVVERVEHGWVHVHFPRGLYSVPVRSVERVADDSSAPGW